MQTKKLEFDKYFPILNGKCGKYVDIQTLHQKYNSITVNQTRAF